MVLKLSHTALQSGHWLVPIIIADLCGTPGYLAPEVLKSSMFEDAEGYSKEVDM